MGVVPAACPADPYFGEFEDQDPAFMIKAAPPGSHFCYYAKGQWTLAVGMIPGMEEVTADCKDDPPIQIAGTDLACLKPDTGEAGELALGVGNRSLKFQFSGSSDDAIEAAKRFIGLA
jgi:hypothetical protein